MNKWVKTARINVYDSKYMRSHMAVNKQTNYISFSTSFVTHIEYFHFNSIDSASSFVSIYFWSILTMHTQTHTQMRKCTRKYTILLPLNIGIICIDRFHFLRLNSNLPKINNSWNSCNIEQFKLNTLKLFIKYVKVQKLTVFSE